MAQQQTAGTADGCTESLNRVGRLHASEHLVGDKCGIGVSTVGVEFLPLGFAPHGEIVRVNVNADHAHAFCLETFAAGFGRGKPLIVGPMEFVTVFEHGAEPLEVLSLEPNHAGGLNTLGHHESPEGSDAANVAHTSITTGQATQAFEAWEQDYRDNPETFYTPEEVARLSVASVSESRAIHFMALLRSQQGDIPPLVTTTADITEEIGQIEITLLRNGSARMASRLGGSPHATYAPMHEKRLPNELAFLIGEMRARQHFSYRKGAGK